MFEGTNDVSLQRHHCDWKEAVYCVYIKYWMQKEINEGVGGTSMNRSAAERNCIFCTVKLPRSHRRIDAKRMWYLLKADSMSVIKFHLRVLC